MFAFEMCVDVDALEWIRFRVGFCNEIWSFWKNDISSSVSSFCMIEKHSSFRNGPRWIFWIILQL
jgi:hypothetical protein